jgi:hypothetical protein
MKREKFFNPYTDQNCTYIENAPPFFSILMYWSSAYFSGCSVKHVKLSMSSYLQNVFLISLGEGAATRQHLPPWVHNSISRRLFFHEIREEELIF